MRLGIMQPYFFPYLGHYSMIAAVDKWLIFDISQYAKKSWMNRNRVLHPDSGWQYITVPVGHISLEAKTYQVQVLNNESTKQRILSQLLHYKRRAPYFADVHALVRDVFDSTKTTSLVELNANSLRLVCAYLDIKFDFELCSMLDLSFPDQCMEPGDWAPEISRQLNARQYLNPISGIALFNPERFKSVGIDLLFADFTPFVYETGSYQFEPGLSIIDVLMWNQPSEVAHVLHQSLNIVAS